MKVKVLATAACLLATPALAQVNVNTITETNLGNTGGANGLVYGTATISTTSPWNAVIRLIPGTALDCTGFYAGCPLNFMEIGFEMAGFSTIPGAPICQASLMDGAFFGINGTNQETENSWPPGTMLTVNYDPAGIPANGQGRYTYYIRMYGAPLGNPTLHELAASFVPGQQLRVSVMCGPK